MILKNKFVVTTFRFVVPTGYMGYEIERERERKREVGSYSEAALQNARFLAGLEPGFG